MANEAVRAQALELLPALKQTLWADGQEQTIRDSNLLKFLHWKQDVGRAAGRIRAHEKWRRDTPFAFDDPPLRASVDPILRKCLESEIIVAPDGLFDKEGRAVLIGRLRNNDMAATGSKPPDVARMAFYTIDRVLETNMQAQTNGVCVFHDLTGLGRKNLHPQIPQILFNGLIGHYPLQIKAIYIYNAPWFFWAFFKVASLMMPSKLRQRVQFVSSLEDVYAAIDQDELLVEHGGKREHDQHAWVAAHAEREADAEGFGSLSDLKPGCV